MSPPYLVLVGFIVYLVGLILAGGPRRPALNWVGTFLSASGLALLCWGLYQVELM